MSKILVNAGPSRRGWHRLEAMARCPQLFARKFLVEHGDTGAKAMPLVRGSIGHVGLAHYYSRLRAEQMGDDPGAYYEPSEAMEIAAGEFGEVGREMLPVAATAVQAYRAFYATDRFMILAIENEYISMIQDSRGWGPYEYTARVDLEYEDSSGKVIFTDYKFVTKIEGKTLKRYTNSGQFLGLRWFGRAIHGDRFGGIVISLIQVGDKPRFARIPLDPAPNLEARFPQIVCDLEGRISTLSSHALADYPYTPTEYTCVTPYGSCEFYDACRWGE